MKKMKYATLSFIAFVSLFSKGESKPAGGSHVFTEDDPGPPPVFEEARMARYVLHFSGIITKCQLIMC